MWSVKCGVGSVECDVCDVWRGKCGAWNLECEVVLGSALCKLCSTKYYWEVPCARPCCTK